jgi:hypothetical protein
MIFAECATHYGGKKKTNTHSVKHGPMNASVMLNHDDDAMQVGKKQLKKRQKRKRSVVQ